MSALVPRWQVTVKSIDDLLSVGEAIITRSGAEIAGYRASGRLAWRREIDGLQGVRPMLATAGALFVVAGDIRRLDPRSGRTLARRELGPDLHVYEAGSGLGCWTPSTGTLQVLDPQSLATVASCPDPEGRLSAHDGFFCGPGEDGDLHVRDLHSRREVRVPVPEAGTHLHADSRLYVIGPRARLAYALEDGRVLWRVEADDDILGGYRAVHSGDLAVVRRRQGFGAYSLEDGSRRWCALAETANPRYGAEVADGLWLAAVEREIAVLEISTGSVRGRATLPFDVANAVLLRGGLVVAQGLNPQFEVDIRALSMEPAV